jgi:phosphinothricin acetyltransferase
LPNPASVALHEAIGFRPIGVYRAVGHKFKAWHDVGWWQLALRERVGTPSPPLALGEARSLSGWEAALGAGLETPRP